MNGDHIFGRAPHMFALDADVPEPTSADEETIREHRAALKRSTWARGRASRFAERASFANACRVDRERVKAMLVEAVARRAAAKSNGLGREPEAATDQTPNPVNQTGEPSTLAD